MIENLFKKLKGLKINVRVVDGRLDLEASRGVLTNELLDEIKIRKEELIGFINSYMNVTTLHGDIPVTGRKDRYPLSSSQRMLWIVSQSEAGNIAYNMPGVIVVEGDLDHAALASSFAALLQRHESLRTVFRQDGQGEVWQYVLSPDDTGPVLDFRDLRNAGDKDRIAESLVQKTALHPFDLSAGPMVRAGLYRTEDKKWIFAYTMHHIISDGWSMDILVRELFQLYDLAGKGEDPVLPPLRIQYKDYVAWQEGQTGGDALQTHKSYWLKQFEGELPVLELPAAKVRPAIKTYNGGIVNRRLGAGIGKGLAALVRQEDCTLFMGLLAAVSALLYRYTGQEDLIIGTPIAGREHPDLEDQIGFYVRTLALRLQFSGKDHYRDLLMNARRITLEAHEHQAYPFAELVGSLHLRRDISRNPLFDVQVVLIQDAMSSVSNEPASFGRTNMSGYEGETAQICRFDMVFGFSESGEQLQAFIQYNSDIYSRSMVEQLSGHLHQILESILQDPLKPIRNLDYLNPAEKNVLLSDFRGGHLEYDRNRTVINLFDDQADRNPDNIALVCGPARLTYNDLRERSEWLAAYLRANYAIQADDRIGIMLDRSEDMLIAILGVLKSGGAYVPIDPDYPAARKEYMITDSHVKLLITQTDYIFDVPFYKGAIFCMDAQMDGMENPVQMPVITIHPDDLAYVIYTSGSTGDPKGVMIKHSGFYHFTAVSLARYPSVKSSILLSSIAFDMSVASIFGTLCCGGRLYLASKISVADVRAIADCLVEEKVNFFFAVPSYYGLLMAELAGRENSLEIVVVAGETCPTQLVERHFSIPTLANCQLVNEYGPTEATIWATVHPYERGKEIFPTIGKPIENTGIYILDPQNNIVPIGVTGEMYISGPGLARGYLNSPGLSLEKFVHDPFMAGGYMYRTGDFGRWMEGGNIDFIGRKDEQVKIRGYRIETREIEIALQSHSSIGSAVVILRRDEHGNDELVAYLVSPEALNVSDLKPWLEARLPAYAIPTAYVQLESLPLTPNGKTDRKKLPDPQKAGMAAGSEYTAPRTVAEATMVSIWEGILDRQKIGIRDSFFDLGGDSIRILKMISELRGKLDIEMPVDEIYKNPTIEKISGYLASDKYALERKGRNTKALEAVISEEIETLKKKILALDTLPDRENIEDIYPMSDIEKGMVFESLLHEHQGIYHDQMVCPWTFSDFETGRFSRALELLVEKHSILRTGFNLNEYEAPVQIVYRKIPVAVYYEDLSFLVLKAQETSIRKFIAAEFKKPFDVSSAPLWRMAAFNLGGNNIVFVFQCHHAIIDGWSDSMFLTELYNLYLRLEDDPAYRPASLRFSYKDFIIQHEIDKRNDQIQEFWKNELTDFRRTDLFTTERQTDYFTGRPGKHVMKNLEQLSRKLNTSVKCISLSAYLYLQKLLSYDNEIVAGVVTHTRPGFEDSDKILGCFLNTIPFRGVIGETATWKEWITWVNDKLIELKEYERLSLPEIARIADAKLDAGNPFFDTFFNYVDFHSFKSLKEDTGLGEDRPLFPDINLQGNGSTNTFLDLSVNATGENYQATFSLNRKLKCGLSSRKLAGLYFNILENMIADPAGGVNAKSCLDASEDKLLLETFNDTASPYEWNKTVPRLLEEQAEATPDAIALLFEQKIYTYRELHERANRFAHYLRAAYYIQADDMVGIRLDRSDRMVVAMVGVLKSGGAYVPMDPDYPEERIRFIIDDSRCRVVIDEAEFSRFAQRETEYGSDTPVSVNGPADLAYVIYTSGSTGQPKGVMINHRSVAAFIGWSKEEFGHSDFDVVLGVTSICFDLSVFELFYTLSSGKRLRLVRNALSDTGYLNGDEKLLLNTVPGVVGALLRDKVEMGAVRVLNMAGEPIPPQFLPEFDYGRMEVRNLYGPTEDTVYSSSYRLKRGAAVLIGRPISNSRIYILNEAHQLLPAGVAGELYIAGAGLARGYLNRPALTAERFVADPFRSGEKMYRTGDLGRWLPDGNIELLGRKDRQVKIRGYRIEPGEIEQVLQAYPGIGASVVEAKVNREGEKELVAYIVSGEAMLNPGAIRSYLAAHLPEYMVPGWFVLLKALPLLANGKTDRKSLPDPEGLEIETGREYVAPRNEMEERLVSIWQEVLGRKKISVRDNFFEIGGHSLKVMKLLNVMKKKHGIQMKLRDVYNHPTIEEMALGRSEDSKMIRLNRSDKVLNGNIYFIPPMLGSSVLYKPLADKLKNRYACYGFQYSGLERDEPLCESIEQVAADLSNEILRLQKDDEFVILGYSMGAAVAFEMAKILEKEFKSFKLILIDRNVSKADDVQPDDTAIAREVKMLIGKYKRLIYGEEIDEAALERFLSNSIRKLNNYIQTGSVESMIYAFEAEDNRNVSRMKEWEGYTTGGVKLSSLAGDHWDALSEENHYLFEEAISEAFSKTAIMLGE